MQLIGDRAVTWALRAAPLLSRIGAIELVESNHTLSQDHNNTQELLSSPYNELSKYNTHYLVYTFMFLRYNLNNLST